MPEQANPFATGDDVSLDAPLSDAEEKNTWIVYGVLIAALTWGYWNMMAYTATFWDNPLYSHGWIIPLICGFLFWQRRQKITSASSNERWVGVGIVVACLIVRLWASTHDVNPLDRLSYVGALLGITQIIGGTRMLKWAGPPLAFLVFMFPLPAVLENSVLLWLQRAAAYSSTWALQLLGIPALREGSRIIIDELELDVADACSGLRMSTIFGAMSVALAMMINRPWWDRLAILVSAIPVALVTNVIRITVTALIFMATDSEAIHSAVHDWAGFAMMPVAMGILWLELQILHKITVPIDTEDYSAFAAHD